VLTFWMASANAAELRWGFGPSDGMPYVEVRDHLLLGGFIRQFGEQVSERLGLVPQFIETPNKRLEAFLQQGRIHLICNLNPEWVADSRLYHWSPVLFEEEDALLQHADLPPLHSLQALHGKVLGTSLGYIYTVPLMEAFARGDIVRQDVHDLETRMLMLGKQRLDAVIDMRRALRYELTRHPDLPLRFSPWVVQRYNMHCAYGKQLPVSAERLDDTISSLREQGIIAALLEQEQTRLSAQRNR
jgi:ABC-type amino acid transport substrate-binding protein